MCRPGHDGLGLGSFNRVVDNVGVIHARTQRELVPSPPTGHLNRFGDRQFAPFTGFATDHRQTPVITSSIGIVLFLEAIYELHCNKLTDTNSK